MQVDRGRWLEELDYDQVTNRGRRGYAGAVQTHEVYTLREMRAEGRDYSEAQIEEAGLPFIMIDGGDGKHGSLASRTVRQTFGDEYEQYLQSPDKPDALHQNVVQKSYDRLKMKAVSGSISEETSISLAMVLIRAAEVHICHVGTGQIFLHRRGDSPTIALHPQVNTTERIRLESGLPQLNENSFEIQYGKHDLILCSDALNHGTVAETEIVKAIRQFSAEEVCTHLIRLANQADVPQNISVITIKTTAPDGEQTEPRSRVEPVEVAATDSRAETTESSRWTLNGNVPLQMQFEGGICKLALRNGAELKFEVVSGDPTQLCVRCTVEFIWCPHLLIGQSRGYPYDVGTLIHGIESGDQLEIKGDRYTLQRRER